MMTRLGHDRFLLNYLRIISHPIIRRYAFQTQTEPQSKPQNCVGAVHPVIYL
jgi:hypothetical protein